MKEMVPFIDAAAVEIVKAGNLQAMEKTLTTLSMMFPIKRTVKGCANPLDPVSRLLIFRMGLLRTLELDEGKRLAGELLGQIRQEELEGE